MRKICVVTGTRAEYGILRPLLYKLKENANVCLQLVATGTHLTAEFGRTVDDIENDGFEVSDRVQMLLASDCPIGVTKSLGLATIGFADLFARIKPDLLVLLGDRYEMLSAAQAALIFRIPIAHIHGGEATEGLIDDAIRHSISKMASLHFVSTPTYRARLLSMGESPERVFNFGAMGIDNLGTFKQWSKEQLQQQLGFSLREPIFILTYHPVTLLSEFENITGARELVRAICDFKNATIIVTGSNADTFGKTLFEELKKQSQKQNLNVNFVTNLGSDRYLSLLKISKVMIGNSSSGIIEAHSLGLPVVNIGRRQRGRIKASSVIDCNEDASSIASAIRVAISDEHRTKTLSEVSPYFAGGNVAEKIMEVLESIDLANIQMKSFYDRNSES